MEGWLRRTGSFSLGVGKAHVLHVDMSVCGNGSLPPLSFSPACPVVECRDEQHVD